MSKKIRNVDSKQNGVILVVLAIGMIAILGMVGLGIDMGHSYLNKSRLQNALDSAALSGALTLHQFNHNTVLASAHATDTFDEHKEGDLGADAVTLEIEYSNTLVPFVPGGLLANYIRVKVADFDSDLTFSSILPGIGNSMAIGGSAVAGAFPLGGGERVCDIAPIIVCGDPNDLDSTDDTLFGLPYDDGTGSVGKMCLKASAATGGNGNGGGNEGVPDDCNEPLDEIGPGNFQLIQLDCGPGGACVGDNLAGSYNGCLTNTDVVTTKPGDTVGPTAQGFNTRFGDYKGRFGVDDYPPDFVTAEDINYNEYLTRYENETFNYPSIGVAERRVMTVPIGNCAAAGNGQTDIPVLALGCFFMTDKTEGNGKNNWIKGTLVKQCQASGIMGENPDSGPVDGSRPIKIILYKDPDSVSS